MSTQTLGQALRHTSQTRWAGLRSHQVLLSQAKAAVAFLGEDLPLSEVTPQALRNAATLWRTLGASPATINKRLNCLSAMGVSVQGCRAKPTNALKWWLTPEDLKRVQAVLEPGDVLRDFIEWTVETGLRVEESLRLTRTMLSGDCSTITVPGTKGVAAQATLPLSKEAAKLALWRYSDQFGRDPLFPVTYLELLARWNGLKSDLGIDHPGATLKALRRSAARTLSVKGMPIDMIRQYLRHENIKTTMGYLKLTGGYNESEMRKWLA